MKFAKLNNDGVPTAFFDSVIHVEHIPHDAVRISDAQWQECIDNAGRRLIVVSGDTVSVIPHEPVPSTEALAASARSKRDRLLKDSDWTLLSDAPVDRDAWTRYRQALRDTSKQPGFPNTIDWPTAPGA